MLRAEMAGETRTSAILPSNTGERSISACLAAAEAELAAGNVAEAYNMAKQMIESASPSEEAGAAAEQIAARLAKAHSGEEARELYLYATKCATGISLRKALCGLAEIDAVKGDGKAAYEAVVRLGEEFAGDAEAVKAINRVGERYLRDGRNERSRDVYCVAAEKWAGTEYGMKALAGVALASNSAGEYGEAAEAGIRLLQEYPKDRYRNRMALEIGHKLAQFRQFEAAEAIYRAIEKDNPDRKDVAGIAAGRIVVAINQNRFEEAAAQVAALGKSASPDAWACKEIGNAYFDRQRFDEAGAVFRRMVELETKVEVARQWQGKVVRSAILGGDEAAAIKETRKLLQDYPGVSGEGKALFDAVITTVRGNRPSLGSRLIEECAGMLSEPEDLMWMEAGSLGLSIASDASIDSKTIAEEFLAKWGSGREETIGAVFEIGRLCSAMVVSEKRGRSDTWPSTIMRAQGVFQAILDQTPGSKYAPESCWRSATYFDMLNNTETALEYAQRLVAAWPGSEYAPGAYQMLLREYRSKARRTPDAENVQRVMAISQTVLEKFPDNRQLAQMATAALDRWTNAMEKGGVK